MSPYINLQYIFEAFKVRISETLPSALAYHSPSNDYSVEFMRQRLVEYEQTANELKKRVWAYFKPSYQDDGGPFNIPSCKIPQVVDEAHEVEEAVDRFVDAVREETAALDAMERMKREQDIVKGKVERIMKWA